MNPADAPTVTSTPTSAQADLPSGLTTLPTGNVLIAGRAVPVRSLVGTVLALVPADCACEQQWDRLGRQAVTADVRLYFVATGPQRAAEAIQYVYGQAVPADDADSVLANAYRPDGLTVLLVYSNAKVQVRRNLGSSFQLGPALSELKSASAKPSKQATPEASAAAAG